MSYAFFGGKTPDYGGNAVKEERARQALIQQGSNLINAVYGGGTVPYYSPATDKAFDPTKTYYRIGKGGFEPFYVPGNKSVTKSTFPNTSVGSLTASSAEGLLPGISFLGGGGGPLGLFGHETTSWKELVNNALKKNRLFQKGEDMTFEGFQPSFFDERAQAYEKYALPQLGEQYRQTRNQLLFNQANRGFMGSSAAQQQGSELERTTARAKQGIADVGLSQAQELRRQLDEAKNQQLAFLYQSADPAQALQQATSTAAQFRQPSIYSPLANQFSSLVNAYYLSQALNNYRPGGYGPNQADPYGNAGALPSTFLSVGR